MLASLPQSLARLATSICVIRGYCPNGLRRNAETMFSVVSDRLVLALASPRKERCCNLPVLLQVAPANFSESRSDADVTVYQDALVASRQIVCSWDSRVGHFLCHR